MATTDDPLDGRAEESKRGQQDHQTSSTRENLEFIATDTLDVFEKVAEAADRNLRDNSPVAPQQALANINTLTSANTVQKLEQIRKQRLESAERLAREPAVSRILVSDEKGNKSVFYICRTTPVSVPDCNAKLASYHSPVGRMASLLVGEVFLLPDGPVEILESARLRPMRKDEGWDSHNTVIDSVDYGPITVASLRALRIERDADDLLDSLLAEESESTNIIEGIRRSVITKMGLRDQPILDQFQDEIFRMPIDSQLLILGPPGTGKTTTLIHRLGQKLDAESLREEERDLLLGAVPADSTSHSQSWMMFTPTELLKQYVKEAFAREGIPASDRNIGTWADFRRELARSVFGVLRTGAGGGTYVVKESLKNLAPEAEKDSIAWYFDFEQWHKKEFLDGLEAAADELSRNTDSRVAKLGRRLAAITRTGGRSLPDMLVSLGREASNLRTFIDGLKQVTDEKIRVTFTLHLNRNKTFLDELALFIERLEEVPDSEGDDPIDQESDEEDDERDRPKLGRAAAYAAYRRALRAQAIAQAKNRSLGKMSRNARIIAWLGDRTLAEHELSEVGKSLVVQAAARRFVNAARKYINGIPTRYRAFRRTRLEGGKWYLDSGFNRTDIYPLELDVVLLAMLRAARDLVSAPSVAREINEPYWSAVKPIHDLFRNQILVDEAADFSPVQIACMAALAHPRIQSVFACGDFNQRLTTWGSRTLKEVKWALPSIEVRTIAIAYRQTRQLHELAKAIIVCCGGEDPGLVLPRNVDNDGVAPVLIERAQARVDVAHWLAKRIIEIESFVQQLPSIAILVNSEDQVAPLSQELNEALAKENIRVVACPNGQVKGQDNDVRVFDVQHIKGLEFEAVFFVDIDQLAKMQPDLFDKYLYVGATRAATYVGFTCEDVLPERVASLRAMFVDDWSLKVAKGNCHAD